MKAAAGLRAGAMTVLAKSRARGNRHTTSTANMYAQMIRKRNSQAEMGRTEILNTHLCKRGDVS